MTRGSFPLIGSSVKSLAYEASYERSLNLQEISVGPKDAQGNGRTALIHSPGLLGITTIPGQSSRGIFTANDQTYMVVDNAIYRITINLETLIASYNQIGTVQSSSGTIRFAANPTQIIFVDGTENGYVINLDDDTFTTINSDDSFYGGTHIVYIDGYFIYNVINSSQLRASSLNNGLSWNDATVATAENHPDGIVGLGVTKGELWVLGTETAEVWFDAATTPPGFPFEPRIGAALTIGCDAGYSILEVNNTLIFIDNRGFLVQSQVSPYVRSQSSVYELNVISPFELNSELSQYDRLDDIISCSYNDRGSVMYQFTSPSAHTTWVLNLESGKTHERSYFNPYYEQHREHLCQYQTKQGNLNLMCGYRDGTLYIQSDKYYTDNGVLIHRVRRVAPYLNQGKLVDISQLELRLTCPANATSPGDDPQVILRYSNDGGHHWSDDIPRAIGKVGQTATHILWNRLGSATEWVFEFTITEPLPITLIEAYFDGANIKEE